MMSGSLRGCPKLLWMIIFCTGVFGFLHFCPVRIFVYLEMDSFLLMEKGLVFRCYTTIRFDDDLY